MKRGAKICLLGAALDTGNMGVSALSVSLIGLIKEIIPNAEIYLLIGNQNSIPQSIIINKKPEKINIVNYRLSPKSEFRHHLFVILLAAFLQRFAFTGKFREAIVRRIPWLKIVSCADFIGDIRGGDSFSDIYGFSRFFWGILPLISIKLIKKPYTLLPQTYGPYKSKLSKILSRYILSHAENIITRDQRSINTINVLLGEKSQKRIIQYCPDVAFWLKSTMPKNLRIFPTIEFKESKRIIGLNINGLLYNGGYTGKNMFMLKCDYADYIKQLINKVLIETQYEILLIPHTFGSIEDVNSDNFASKFVHGQIENKLRKRVHIVQGVYNQNEIKGIINLCSFFVGSRMHACIAAISQGIPTIALAYSHKFEGVFNSIGFGHYVIDAKKVDTDNALRQTFRLFLNTHAPHDEIMLHIKKAKSITRSVIQKNLFSSINQVPFRQKNKLSI